VAAARNRDALSAPAWSGCLVTLLRLQDKNFFSYMDIKRDGEREKKKE